MKSVRWLKKAAEQSSIRITDNIECPCCKSTHRTDVPLQLNACEKQLWVSIKWFEGKYGKEPWAV